MAKVLKAILDAFYQKLSESEAIDAQKVSDLRALFESGKKLKADDVIAVVSGANPKQQ